MTSRAGIEYCPDTGEFTSNGIMVGTVGTSNYATMYYQGKKQLCHRVAFHVMTGEWPPDEVDHINGDKLDNRWHNLRLVKRYENIRYRSQGGAGVYPLGQKWRAVIHSGGEQHFLGMYDDWFEAMCARKSAEVKLWNCQ